MQTIELDLAMRRIVPLLHAKQNDVGKKVSVVLTDNGAAYSIPGDAVFSVWYSGASGEGNYTTIDGRSAFSVSGNTVTVELILQMLQNKGPGQLCLVMNKADGTQLGLWNIPYSVEEIPGAGSQEATAYYTAFLEAAQAMGAAGIESDTFPGCYYRIVNGETEWMNPPMVSGEEYRTTERYKGKTVYTKLVDCGGMTNGSICRIISDHTQIIRYAATDGRGPLPFIYGSMDTLNTTWTAMLADGGLVLYEKAGATHAIKCQVWYTKD